MTTDHVIVTDISGGSGFKTPEPHVRDVRVLLSPILQDWLEDFSIGFTKVPPGQKGSKHNHPNAAEIWLFFEGIGRAIVGD